MAEVHDMIDESLVRICEFVVEERKRLMDLDIDRDWLNRASYLVHATLVAYR